MPLHSDSASQTSINLFFAVGTSQSEMFTFLSEIARAEIAIGVTFDVEMIGRGIARVGGDKKGLVALRLMFSDSLTEVEELFDKNNPRTRPCHKCEWYSGNRWRNHYFARCVRPNRASQRSLYVDRERIYGDGESTCGHNGIFFLRRKSFYRRAHEWAAKIRLIFRLVRLKL